MPAILLKRLQRKCFPVKNAKFFRTPFFIEHLQRLLLDSGKSLMLLSQQRYVPVDIIFQEQRVCFLYQKISYSKNRNTKRQNIIIHCITFIFLSQFRFQRLKGNALNEKFCYILQYGTVSKIDINWVKKKRSKSELKFNFNKTITSGNVSSEAQVKNCFISQKVYVPLSAYSSFCIFKHSVIYQIRDVMISISI